MRKLIVHEQEFEVERIVKIGNEIIGYIGTAIVFTFRGVNDFEAFTIEDGLEYDVV